MQHLGGGEEVKVWGERERERDAGEGCMKGERERMRVCGGREEEDEGVWRERGRG